MRKLPGIIISILFLLVGLSSQANAAAGPTGLNQFRAEGGPGAGQITLNWSRYYPNVDNYSILYGTQPGKYIYGAANIGNTVTFTVGALTPGVRYYFSLQSYAAGQPLPSISGELSEVAPSAPRTVIGSAGPVGLRSLSAVQGPGTGKVTLTWQRTTSTTDNYHIVYGLKPGQYIYGALNVLGGSQTAAIGTQYSYTVGALSSGTRYYFALMPTTGNQSLAITAEVSQVAP